MYEFFSRKLEELSLTRFVHFNVGIRIGIIAPYIYSEKICTVGRLDWYPSTLIGIFWCLPLVLKDGI